MSQSARPPNRSAPITLITVNHTMQAGLLAKVIGETVGVPCEVRQDCSALAPSRLVLIDCSGQNDEQLRQLASSLHACCEDCSAALINAEHSGEHESLLDWPHISGIFYLDTEQEQLIYGLQCLLRGEYWVPRRLLHHLLDKNRRVPSTRNQAEVKLTKRERQILKHLRDGATNSHISVILEVSEHTVKSHLYNLYKKIGVRNRIEASRWASDLPGFDSP